MAVAGGYGTAWLGAAALAVSLPLPRHDAVTLAVMLAFVLYLLFILWVFATATLLRAALGLIVPAALFGVCLLLVTPETAPAEPAGNERTRDASRPAGKLTGATTLLDLYFPAAQRDAS